MGQSVIMGQPQHRGQSKEVIDLWASEYQQKWLILSLNSYENIDIYIERVISKICYSLSNYLKIKIGLRN